jgi:hypothetical protein
MLMVDSLRQRQQPIEQGILTAPIIFTPPFKKYNTYNIYHIYPINPLNRK